MTMTSADFVEGVRAILKNHGNNVLMCTHKVGGLLNAYDTGQEPEPEVAAAVAAAAPDTDEATGEDAAAVEGADAAGEGVETTDSTDGEGESESNSDA